MQVARLVSLLLMKLLRKLGKSSWTMRWEPLFRLLIFTISSIFLFEVFQLSNVKTGFDKSNRPQIKLEAQSTLMRLPNEILRADPWSLKSFRSLQVYILLIMLPNSIFSKLSLKFQDCSFRAKGVLWWRALLPSSPRTILMVPGTTHASCARERLPEKRRYSSNSIDVFKF